MRVCKFRPTPFSPNVNLGTQNLELSAPGLSASASSTPEERNTLVDADPLFDITNSGEDVMESYFTFPPLGGEFELESMEPNEEFSRTPPAVGF
jgi:hypothetical protein